VEDTAAHVAVQLLEVGPSGESGATRHLEREPRRREKRLGRVGLPAQHGGRGLIGGNEVEVLGGDRDLVNGTVGDILDLPARRVTGILSTMPSITVAKVNGFCFTGALELAIACDIIVAAEEAKFGDTHAEFGLRPTWGTSQRLPRLVGVAALAEDLLANSAGSLRAYKDLYREAMQCPLDEDLSYEASTPHPIDDTAARLADLR